MSKVIPFRKRAEPEPEFEKVYLPGEWPWVIVRSRNPRDGSFLGEINNHLVGTGIKHPYRCGDLVRFAWLEAFPPDGWAWMPVVTEDDEIDRETNAMIDRKFRRYGLKLGKLLLDQWAKRN
jgi:hypothetical protein